jgi:hypothetical protein
MTTVQDGPPKPVKDSEPLTTLPESARLIVVAIGWLLFAAAVPEAVRFAAGFKRASQLEIPPTLGHLLFSVGAWVSCFFMLLQDGAVSWVAVTVSSGWGLHLLRGFRLSLGYRPLLCYMRRY